LNYITQLKFRAIRNDCEPKKLTYVQNGQISVDWSILNAIMNNIRLEKIFIFAKYRRIADFNDFSQYSTARCRKS